MLHRKITRAISRIALGLQDRVYVGNLSAQRDWGHAKDYVRAMYLMLQQDQPDDYVIATGVTTSIRDFTKLACKKIGLEIEFTGEGSAEMGRLTKVDNDLVEQKLGANYVKPLQQKANQKEILIAVDPGYYRPTEVDLLIGDATKAREKLGWQPEYNLEQMVEEMMQSDIHLMQKETYLKEGGYKTLNYFE